MSGSLTAAVARSKHWQEVLMLLDGWELLYGELPKEAWDEIGPLVAAIDRNVTLDVASIRAAAQTDIDAAAPAEPEVVVDIVAETAAAEPEARTDEVEPEPEPATDEVLPEAEPGATIDDAPPEATTDGREPAADSTEPEPATATETADTADGTAPAATDAAGTEAIEDASDKRWSDVASAILKASGRDMHAKDIWEWSLEHGPSKPTSGKTPWDTIARDIREAIKRGDTRFARGAKRGTFRAA